MIYKINNKMIDLSRVSYYNRILATEEVNADGPYKNMCKLRGNGLALILDGHSMFLWGEEADNVYDLLAGTTTKQLLKG
jgi:hypothetical protein